MFLVELLLISKPDKDFGEKSVIIVFMVINVADHIHKYSETTLSMPAASPFQNKSFLVFCGSLSSLRSVGNQRKKPPFPVVSRNDDL